MEKKQRMSLYFLFLSNAQTLNEIKSDGQAPRPDIYKGSVSSGSQCYQAFTERSWKLHIAPFRRELKKDGWPSIQPNSPSVIRLANCELTSTAAVTVGGRVDKHTHDIVGNVFFLCKLEIGVSCATYLLGETAILVSLSFKVVCCCVIRHVFESPGRDKKTPKRIMVQDVWDRGGGFDRLFKL